MNLHTGMDKVLLPPRFIPPLFLRCLFLIVFYLVLYIVALLGAVASIFAAGYLMFQLSLRKSAQCCRNERAKSFKYIINDA